MAKNAVLFYLVAASSSLVLGSQNHAVAQNGIKLLGSTFVRNSANGSSVTQPNTFNSPTISLSCPASGIHAVLSSTPDGSGNVLVDNFIRITVTNGNTMVSGPANVCHGGATEVTPSGAQNNCFNATYHDAAQGFVGQDLSSYAATGGVPPIDVSSMFVAGTQQARIDLVDTGVLLTNAPLYLVTSCTQLGVTGPAMITGNPIPGNGAGPDLLNQDFDFDSTTGQEVGFTYDLSTSQTNGSLKVTDGTIPTTHDAPLDPALWQSQYATGTSFATSSCLVHTGELFNGLPACKLYTLTCQVGTGVSAAGALCPVSSLRDEVFSDKFTGPTFLLPDIPGPNGKTYHTGVGILMASEGWMGGPCRFDAASGLQADGCPQNLLTNLTVTPAATPLVATTMKRLGLMALMELSIEDSMDFDGTGTHPNSTFVSAIQVPQDLTTVTILGAHPGAWVNSHAIKAGMVSEPPMLPSTIPNSQNFVASPIKSITYGISPASMVPRTKFVVPGDVTLTNPVGCPMPAPQATMFAPGTQTLTVAADGAYALHYFAQDCAGTEELKFNSTGGGGWSTSFYTVLVNVDTVLPVITSGPTFSVAPTTIGGVPSAFVLGQKVKVSYSCTDDRAGVATCGSASFGAPGTLNTGVVTDVVDTLSVGQKTLTVMVTDAAGNIGTPAVVTYNVVGGSDLAVTIGGRSAVQAGGRILYDIAVTNLGPSTAKGVVITDVIPAGTTFVSATLERVAWGSCALKAGTVTCNVGDLQAGADIGLHIILTVTAPSGTVLTDTVSVGSLNPDSNPANNTATRQTIVH
jgi:uncharacterized repeat protein (TIGR01451 family)